MTTDEINNKGKGSKVFGASGNNSTNASTVSKDELLPWVEKYRPATLDEVTGHENIISTIRQFIVNKRVPHMLFYGPPGTGKTTTILAIARELFGAKNMKNMVLELNASDDRGIDVVRNQIKTFASTKQMFASGGTVGNNATNGNDFFKLVILDEADAMTNTAQNALRRIIEKYTTHTRFCIIANYAHKINPALLSRCTKFRFSPLPEAAIAKRLEVVVESEQVQIDHAALQALLKLSKGDMRKALNVLQPCKAALTELPGEDGLSGTNLGGSSITEEMIYDCVGSPQPADIQAILDYILKSDWTTALRSITSLKAAKGLALVDILQGISDLFEDYELAPAAKIFLLEGLAEVEFRLAAGGNEKIHTSAAIGVVKSALDIQAAA
ncbi:hypothetical protein D0Z00_002841 [Geotrichum galactomycetum]|uniref:Uncharacterized protein n=1 Tax=Geotrichum galactomycetum TaxID=27317 RepID=A0ACB6V332_9ASCO|nr:hypothetical protein D0Z00_002841 [Geotrichum candidum]